MHGNGIWYSRFWTWSIWEVSVANWNSHENQPLKPYAKLCQTVKFKDFVYIWYLLSLCWDIFHRLGCERTQLLRKSWEEEQRIQWQIFRLKISKTLFVTEKIRKIFSFFFSSTGNFNLIYRFSLFEGLMIGYWWKYVYFLGKRSQNWLVRVFD